MKSLSTRATTLNSLHERLSYPLLVTSSLLIFLMALPSCSEKKPWAGPLTQQDNGVVVQMSTLPNPPSVGDNTLIFNMHDAASQAPVVNADLTVSSFNQLAGGGDKETGRSQGGGTYNVPMRFGVNDAYTIDVRVQRPGQPDAEVKFTIDVE